MLDTNHIDEYWRKAPKIVETISSLPDDALVVTSVINLGEVEAGHQMTNSTDPEKRREFQRFVNQKLLPTALPVSTNTRSEYAAIIGAIWKKYPPNRRARTESTLVAMGLDVNDIWIAAIALEHNLVLVTKDGMAKIREAAPSLRIENWL